MLKIYNDNTREYLEENKQSILEQLEENEEEQSEDNILSVANSYIENDNEQLKEMLKSFDIKNSNNKICVVAVLGLWYGQRKAKKICSSLYDIFFKCIEDSNKVFFKTVKSTLTLQASHHDGTNIFKFYKLVNGKKYAINFEEFVN